MLSPEGLQALVDSLPRLDPCYDLYSLYSKDSFCYLWPSARWLSPLLRALRRGWREPVNPVRAHLAFSRTTAMLVSYKVRAAGRAGRPALLGAR